MLLCQTCVCQPLPHGCSESAGLSHNGSLTMRLLLDLRAQPWLHSSRHAGHERDITIM